MPTFCRGWGTLPFDRSSTDLSAHAILAWSAWYKKFPPVLRRRIDRGIGRRFVISATSSAGTEPGLRCGSATSMRRTTKTRPTAQAACCVCAAPGIEPDRRTGLDFGRLSRAGAGYWALQNTDGGWGGAIATPSSIEETALALESAHGGANSDGSRPLRTRSAITRGVNWLVIETDRGRQFPPTPIGFYFAKLWYFERLYPLIYTVAALGAVENAFAPSSADYETAGAASRGGNSAVLLHPHPSPLPSRERERESNASHRSS